MEKRSLNKPDGRYLHLYSNRPIAEGIEAPCPNKEPVQAKPQLRWHPLRGEWVAYGSHRQGRTFLPPKEYNPLAPCRADAPATELPQGNYEVAVFENLFPTMSRHAETSAESYVPSMPAKGACEVVVFTKDPAMSLSRLPLETLALVLDVWVDRHLELSEREDIQYVMPFENRGIEMGVTLTHPHGQIYAYPFVPPIPARLMEMQEKYFRQHQRSLLDKMLEEELRERSRLICEYTHTAAFVPVCARYPYEVWVAPKRCVPSLADLNREERWSFAASLHTVLKKYDGLWQKSFPYLMVLYQAPVKQASPGFHCHIEFFPPLRTADKLKFLAGTEIGAGLFANDVLPEDAAQHLQAVEAS